MRVVCRGRRPAARGASSLLADEGHEIAASVGDAFGLVEAVERERHSRAFTQTA